MTFIQVHARSKTLHRIAIGCAFVAALLTIHLTGLLLRHWAWDQTEAVRFTADIDNAFKQGTETLRSGYLNRYDEQEQLQDDADYGLDYAPARLLIATEWTRYVRKTVDHQTDNWDLPVPWPQRFYDHARELGKTYELCKPLLILNEVGETIAVAAVFSLVWIWTGRGDRPRRPVWRLVMATTAYALFWFDPELIWNAHCWPQWDSWLLPFFLTALVAASLECWLIAGLLIAAGVMFKAQILFGAPLFILWPAFGGRWRAMLKFIIGFFAGIAAITGVWLVRVNGTPSAAALLWIDGATLAFAGFIALLRVRRRWYVQLAIALPAVALSLWPFIHQPLENGMIAAVVIGIAVLLVWLMPARSLSYFAVAWVAAAVLVCPLLFRGSLAWFDIGIAYGTRHAVNMGSGPNNNLAELLLSQYRFHVLDPVWTFDAHSKMATLLGPMLASIDRRVHYSPNNPVLFPLKYLLLSIYVTAMLLCGLGAALQSRRGSPRFLVAISTPWIVFFTVMTQMHQRYLLWGAATTACTAVLGPGFVLLHLLMSVIAVGQEFTSMVDPRYANLWLWRFFHGWHPGVAWALMLASLIYLYVAVAPGRRRIVKALSCGDAPHEAGQASGGDPAHGPVDGAVGRRNHLSDLPL